MSDSTSYSESEDSANLIGYEYGLSDEELANENGNELVSETALNEDINDPEVPGNDVIYPPTPPPSSGEDAEECEESRVQVVIRPERNSRFWLGQEFDDRKSFKNALFRYALEQKYDVGFYLSKNDKIGAKCRDRNCKWRIYCSVAQGRGVWVVKVYEPTHTCIPTGRTKMLNTGTIASLFAGMLRTNPDMKVREMCEYIANRWGLEVSKQVCAKAKRKAMKFIKSESNEQQILRHAPLISPLHQVMPDRPNNDNIQKDPTESPTSTKANRDGRTITCSNCKRIGHNKRSCMNPTTHIV